MLPSELKTNSPQLNIIGHLNVSITYYGCIIASCPIIIIDLCILFTNTEQQPVDSLCVVFSMKPCAIKQNVNNWKKCLMSFHFDFVNFF